MAKPDIAAVSGNWKALLISPHKPIVAEMSALLHQQLPRMNVFELSSYPSRQALSEFGGASGPNLCFLDLITDPNRGVEVVAELLAVQPNLRVIVLIGSKNPDLILRAMRQGAAEFLVRPFDPSQLEHAVGRIAALDTAGSGTPAGRVITIFPAKGACGASTVASTMAQAAKRAGFKKVLLADLDPITGTISFLHKLKGSYSFLDALNRASTLDVDLWKGIIQTTGGVDVLTAPEKASDIAHDLSDASTIVDYAKNAYEVVIIDTGGAFGSWNLSLARKSDDVVLVTTNELPALQAARRAMDYLEKHHVNRSKMRLVVNRYSKEFGLSREVIETGLHCEIFHLLPSDYESIHRALIEGKTIGSGTNFGKSLAQLADRLTGKAQAAPAGGKKNSTLSTIFSMFSKS